VTAGLLLICITYWFANRFFGRRVARLAAGLLVIDNLVFVTSRTVRADIFVALFAVSGYFVFLHALEVKSKVGMSVAGALIGVSIYTHPNGVLVLVAVVLVFVFSAGREIFRSWYFLYFVAGFVVFVSPYFLYVLILDLSNNFSTFFAQLGENASYLERNFIRDILSENVRYRDYILFPKRFVIFAVQFLSVVFSIVVLGPTARKVAALPLVFCVLLPFWAPQNSTARYFVVIIPAVTVLVSAALYCLYEKSKSDNIRCFRSPLIRRTVLIVVLSVFCLNQIAGEIYILWDHRDNDYSNFVNQMREVIPVGSRVWGSMSFWIGMHDYPFRSQITPCEDVLEFKPEYVVLYDHETWGNRSATVGRWIDRKVYDEIKGQMEKLCEERGEFLRSVDDRYYGNVKIYKIEYAIER